MLGMSIRPLEATEADNGIISKVLIELADMTFQVGDIALSYSMISFEARP